MLSGKERDGVEIVADIPNVIAAESIPIEAMEEINKLMKNGDLFRYTSENSAVKRLEDAFAKKIGANYALAVSSCSAALFLSMKALSLPASASILIPAFTFAAVPSAIIHAGCIPILCECGEDYRIDLQDFKLKIGLADAVLISHMRGHTSDMDAIFAQCDEAGVPIIEDAAHSLGTTWNGKMIGTFGKIGCFSFQSYKLLNSGEGGVLVTDDPEILAKAVIMSGAYEHNWKKHIGLKRCFEKWQNKLPLYNLRLNNLSAVLLNAQLPELERRVQDGRRNHDLTAERLNRSPWISVPEKLDLEERAPDSIQFNLVDLTPSEIDHFEQLTAESGVKMQIFGRSRDNARAFWNWQFLPETFDLPKTRNMLTKACDVRLPARLTVDECVAISDAILSAITAVKRGAAA